ncbi:AEC family transporter [Halalkalibacter sp. APA_J-10(15)]|uniref:AEC family transporter n=1 Tax=unclassified Halalkalibacter TaxID=2893063 RepID=UPI001FF16B62|nr:AEC family transporter [Halalkalibacter sp. APA_J-10(15)]MCK0471859.1 AEC family transporter [Halalkalibacter sp. APA_J-10(15)]
MSFLLIVLPAFLIFAVGFLGQKMIGFDPKPISVLAIYLMSPFLAFRTFYMNPVTINYFYIFAFCLLLCLGLIVVSFVAGKIMKSSESQVSAMVLTGVFMNSGNYGVPIILFAYGTVGFDYAVIMMVIQSFLMSTIGLYYAARGSREGNTMKQAFIKVIRMPLIYGALLGLACQLMQLNIPIQLYQSIDMIADATIPTIMIVLGMQLALIKRKQVAMKELSFIIVMRTIISPVVAYGIILLLPIDQPLASILIVLAAMPSAANTTMFALQFDTEPDLVSFSTLVTTVLSIVTVPIMLMIVSM